MQEPPHRCAPEVRQSRNAPVPPVAYPLDRRRSPTGHLSLCRLTVLGGTLTELNLSDNRLSSIPEGVLGACKKLHYIDLQQNALSTLPGDLADLAHLREINIAYNRCVTRIATARGRP